MKSDLILKNKHFNCLLCELNNLEKDRVYCKHDISHLVEVARIMLLINKKEGLNLPHDTVVASALLHDLGRVYQYKFNLEHRTSANKDIITILTNCNYTYNEIDSILLAINNHDKKTSDKLSALLFRADKLSRPCYICKAKGCYWDSTKRNKEYYK